MRLQPDAGTDLTAHRLQIARAHLAGGFWGGVRPGALCAVRRSVRVRYRAPARFTCWRDPARELVERSRRDTGRPAPRRPGKALALDWLSLPPAEGFAALAVLPAEAKQALFARCIARCSSRSSQSRMAPIRSSRAQSRLAIPFAEFWRPTAANYWGRVKKAHGLAVAETSSAIAGLGTTPATRSRHSRRHSRRRSIPRKAPPIGLDRAARDAAAAWLPPGMAYPGVAGGAPWIATGRSRPLTADPDVADGADCRNRPPAAELPAFLTGDGDGVLDGA